MKNDYYNNSIYHYTNIDTLINYILKDNKIRASQLKNTNDPREYNRKIFGISSSGRMNGNIDPYESDNIINKYINKFKIISFCAGRPDRKSYLKPRMWAQYGAENEGCCIEFNKSELLEVIRERDKYFMIEEEIDIFSKQQYFKSDNINYITYVDDIDNDSVIDSKIDNHAIEESIVNQVLPFLFKTLFEKDIDWNSEDEYRILLKSEKDDYEFIKYKSAIKKIFLGEKVKENVIFDLLPFCEDNNIELYKLVWGTNTFYERKLTKNYIIKRKIESALFKKKGAEIEQYILEKLGRKYWIKYMKILHNREDEISEGELIDFLNLI